MKAKKDNKVYQINTEQEKQRYLKEGYDIYDDEGNAEEYSPLKKIAFSAYVAAVREIEGLRARVKELESQIEDIQILQGVPEPDPEPKKSGKAKEPAEKAGE